jgi:hypothetical protein
VLSFSTTYPLEKPEEVISVFKLMEFSLDRLHTMQVIRTPPIALEKDNLGKENHCEQQPSLTSCTFGNLDWVQNSSAH